MKVLRVIQFGYSNKTQSRRYVHCPNFTEAKNHISVKVDMDEMDVTAAESKATYPEEKEQTIKEALKHFQMIV